MKEKNGYRAHVNKSVRGAVAFWSLKTAEHANALKPFY